MWQLSRVQNKLLGQVAKRSLWSEFEWKQNGQKSSDDIERPMIQMVERAIVQDATDATAVEMPKSASTLFERLSSCLHLPRDDAVTTFSSQSHNWAVWQYKMRVTWGQGM